jgi:ATP-dependent helicase/nuclease subunit A
MQGEPDGSDAEMAKNRGTALHLLLEYLPKSNRADWPEIAARLIPDANQRADIYAEAEAVLTSDALAHIFVSEALTEVAFTADLLGQRALGTIDRLIITPDHVLAIDFKSNYRTPARPQDTPEGILRQMAAYAEALGQIYPNRRIETAILWTRTATLMPLPPDILSAALSRTTIP